MAKKAKRAAAAAQQAGADQPANVVFEYIKSQFFRVVHADGAIGSVTPSGNVHVAFYNERPAIPRVMVHPRLDNGTLGDPISEQTVVRPGMIREMDVDIVLSPIAVEALQKWLVERQKELAKQAEGNRKLRAASRKGI